MELKIEYLPITELKPYENNARKHAEADIEAINKSIEEFGFNDPIGIWHDTIVEGHGRLLAAQELEMEEVPVIRLDHMTDEERRAYALAHNKTAELSEWDFEMLDTELDDIFDIDMSQFGFDISADDEPIEIIEDEVPEDAPSMVKMGDVWQLGEHRLICGDSTEKEVIDKLMGGKKADIVFTDPPYNALTSWKKDVAKAETRLNPNDWFQNDCMTWEQYAVFLDNTFDKFCGHSVYICCDFRIYPIILEALSKTCYDLKHCIVWKKNVWGLGKRYRFQHEFIVYACKNEAGFYGDRSQSDVWEVDVDRTTNHKTPKPVGIPAIAIKNSSRQNNIVLDIFGGSGSTLIACEQLDRKCYIAELDPKYCDVIIQRYINFKGSAEDVFLIRDGEKIPYEDVK